MCFISFHRYGQVTFFNLPIPSVFHVLLCYRYTMYKPSQSLHTKAFAEHRYRCRYRWFIPPLYSIGIRYRAYIVGPSYTYRTLYCKWKIIRDGCFSNYLLSYLVCFISFHRYGQVTFFNLPIPSVFHVLLCYRYTMYKPSQSLHTKAFAEHRYRCRYRWFIPPLYSIGIRYRAYIVGPSYTYSLIYLKKAIHLFLFLCKVLSLSLEKEAYYFCN